MTDANASEPYSSRLDARFDGSSRTVMITVLALIAACSLALAACILLVAKDGYRSWRSPYPTILPRELPVTVTPARPIGSYAEWFGPDDYPPAAIRAEQEGAVRVALLVGVDGRVEACEILTGSGIRRLDRGTCRAAVQHGRFRPARDARGAAIVSRFELPRVRWALPRDER